MRIVFLGSQGAPSSLRQPVVSSTSSSTTMTKESSLAPRDQRRLDLDKKIEALVKDLAHLMVMYQAHTQVAANRSLANSYVDRINSSRRELRELKRQRSQLQDSIIAQQRDQILALRAELEAIRRGRGTKRTADQITP